MLAAVCFTLLSAVALYEEPPGGCHMPPEADATAKIPPTRGAPDYKSAAANGAAASPVASSDDAGRDSLVHDDAVAEEMERELYEKQSEEYIKQEDDWDSIERDYRRELLVRGVVQKIAATLTMAFVCWLLWARYEQLRMRRPRTAAEPPAPTSQQADAPPAEQLPPASAADAHDDNAAGATSDASGALNGAKHH